MWSGRELTVPLSTWGAPEHTEGTSAFCQPQNNPCEHTCVAQVHGCPELHLSHFYFGPRYYAFRGVLKRKNKSILSQNLNVEAEKTAVREILTC